MTGTPGQVPTVLLQCLEGAHFLPSLLRPAYVHPETAGKERQLWPTEPTGHSLTPCPIPYNRQGSWIGGDGCVGCGWGLDRYSRSTPDGACCNAQEVLASHSPIQMALLLGAQDGDWGRYTLGGVWAGRTAPSHQTMDKQGRRVLRYSDGSWCNPTGDGWIGASIKEMRD